MADKKAASDAINQAKNKQGHKASRPTGHSPQGGKETALGLNLPREVLVFTTGGTIEKTYNEADGSLENRESVLQKHIVPQLRLPYTKLQIKTLMCKDSLMMTQVDRDLIVKAITTHMPRGHPIVVVHGTDTMEESARYCARHIAELTVPVVFTGAMKPMGFQDSDAIQNITEALMVAPIIAPGIYISFHNRLFTAGQVRKNRQLNTFEEVAAIEVGSDGPEAPTLPIPKSL